MRFAASQENGDQAAPERFQGGAAVDGGVGQIVQTDAELLCAGRGGFERVGLRGSQQGL